MLSGSIKNSNKSVVEKLPNNLNLISKFKTLVFYAGIPVFLSAVSIYYFGRNIQSSAFFSTLNKKPEPSEKIQKRSNMFYQRSALFQDRKDAGQKLAEKLLHLQPQNPIVYALPRGGVPVAFEVAKALGAPLDLLMVRKIGAPGHEEFGMGAIVDGPSPQMFLNQDTIRMINPSKEYIEATKQKQLREIQRQRSVYLKDQPHISVKGRCAIVVDDGIATGGTARVALKALKAQEADRIVLAVPVAARDTIDEIKGEGQADEVICLGTPLNFSAVGLHYNRFDQTSDEEVIRCMTEARTWLKN